MTAEPGFLDRPDSDSDSMSGLIDGLNISGKIGGNNYGTVFCLKSQSFLHNAISDFHSRDVSDGELYDVVISGASVQCYINNEYDGFRITNNFTPSLICDRFPPRSYFWFNRRMHSRIKDGKDLKWWMHPTMIRISFPDSGKKTVFTPHPNQWEMGKRGKSIEKIETFGCSAIPLGPFEDCNSVQWELDFFNVESLLLSNFKEIHWRAYIFSGLIFRAFFATFGYQGIGLNHVRHLLYNMAHEVPLTAWSMEEQGIHLKTLLTQLCKALAKCKLPNFFISEQNMFKYIPRHNLSSFQYQLKIVLDNLLVSCICALRNLARPTMEKRGEEKCLDFKKLFKIVTVDDSDLLPVINPELGPYLRHFSEEIPHIRRQNGARRSSIWEMDMAKNGARFSIASCQNNFEEAKWKADIAKYYKTSRRSMPDHPDQHISESRRYSATTRNGLPSPPANFSILRKVMVVEFFIQHFIKMISQYVDNNYSLIKAARLIMQVENLCRICLNESVDLDRSHLHKGTIEKYQAKCLKFRKQIGNAMENYCGSYKWSRR
ncbi:hypothetical protein Fcan01_24517 [Folsomia candida]|uniref:Mab-21-like HhH/H2TH-like domain-containing protein n=2 Tax=Folsomia candida TaxID=158441 RepID=A0A226D5A8_FOLCA|nr:hypothetical protein Fcan01_24517 [Folsomia candida]